jgi:hypothetical protein
MLICPAENCGTRQVDVDLCAVTLECLETGVETGWWPSSLFSLSRANR